MCLGSLRIFRCSSSALPGFRCPGVPTGGHWLPGAPEEMVQLAGIIEMNIKFIINAIISNFIYTIYIYYIYIYIVYITYILYITYTLYITYILYMNTTYTCVYIIYIYMYWVNYNISQSWTKAILGWFPLLIMIIVRSQWGRCSLPRYIPIYSHPRLT